MFSLLLCITMALKCHRVENMFAKKPGAEVNILSVYFKIPILSFVMHS